MCDVAAGKEDAADMAVPHELPDGRDVGVSDDKVALAIDDIRTGARKDLLLREPRLCVLPKR